MWMLTGLVIVFILILLVIIDIGGVYTSFTIPEPIQLLARFFIEHLSQILFTVLIIFGILIVINYYKWDLNPIVSKKLVDAVEVEGFDGSNDFCNIYKHSPYELDNQCQQLTKDNCLLTDCCGWLSPLKNNKCISGDKGGPKYAVDNYELDIMHDPIINVLDHWEHREKRR